MSKEPKYEVYQYCPICVAPVNDPGRIWCGPECCPQCGLPEPLVDQNAPTDSRGERGQWPLASFINVGRRKPEWIKGAEIKRDPPWDVKCVCPKCYAEHLVPSGLLQHRNSIILQQQNLGY